MTQRKTTSALVRSGKGRFELSGGNGSQQVWRMLIKRQRENFFVKAIKK